MTDELQLLLDERGVLRTLHRYCHTMDYGLEQEWVDVFTPDGVFDVVQMPDRTTIHCENGRDDLAAYIAQYPKPPHFRKHIVVDPIIEIDGDEATAESYYLFLLRDDDGTSRLFAFGRYFDNLRREGGTWRIARRYAETEAIRSGPVPGVTPRDSPDSST